MRYMIIVKATQDSEAGVIPAPDVIEAMGRFNEELIGAGALVAAEGLQASSKGARVKYENGRHIVTDGPFPATGDLVAGFWIVDVASRSEVIDWVRKIPLENGEEIEIRKVFEAADWEQEGVEPALIEREQRLREGAANG